MADEELPRRGARPAMSDGRWPARSAPPTARTTWPTWSRRSTRCRTRRRRWPGTSSAAWSSKAAAGRAPQFTGSGRRQGGGDPRGAAARRPRDRRRRRSRRTPTAPPRSARWAWRPFAETRRTCSATSLDVAPAAGGADRRPGDAGPLRPLRRAGAGARGVAGDEPAAPRDGGRDAVRPAGLDRSPSSTRWRRARSAAATWTRRAFSCSRHPDEQVRSRAAKLFAAASLAGAQDVVAAYQQGAAS